MIKIKLERWKEVVRLESKDDVFDILDLDYLCGFAYGESISKYIDLADIHKLRSEVENHNNSIKGDGYRWVCDNCEYRCKVECNECPGFGDCLSVPPDDNGTVITNWQQIPNNKIEIIQDKQDEK